jgi:hypothetical protein
MNFNAYYPVLNFWKSLTAPSAFSTTDYPAGEFDLAAIFLTNWDGAVNTTYPG